MQGGRRPAAQWRRIPQGSSLTTSCKCPSSPIARGGRRARRWPCSWTTWRITKGLRPPGSLSRREAARFCALSDVIITPWGVSATKVGRPSVSVLWRPFAGVSAVVRIAGGGHDDTFLVQLILATAAWALLELRYKSGIAWSNCGESVFWVPGPDWMQQIRGVFEGDRESRSKGKAVCAAMMSGTATDGL